MSATIQRPKRISSESLQSELRPAADLVGNSINTFMEETYIAIMGNLGVTSNLNMEFKTLKITVDANGIPTSTVSFKSNLKTKIMGCTVIRAFDAYPVSQPFINFSENQGIATITQVSGLAPNTQYQLVILTIGA